MSRSPFGASRSWTTTANRLSPTRCGTVASSRSDAAPHGRRCGGRLRCALSSQSPCSEARRVTRHAWDTASCRERHDLSSARARRRDRGRRNGGLRPRLASHGEPGPLGSADRGRAAIAQAPRQDPGGVLEALSHGGRLGRLDDAAAGARRARGRVPAGAHARRLRRDERDDGSAGAPRGLRRLGGSRVHGLVVGRRRARLRTQRGRSVSARRPPRPARPRRGVRPRGAGCRNPTRGRSQRRGQRGGRPRPRVAAPRTPLQRPRRATTRRRAGGRTSPS